MEGSKTSKDLRGFVDDLEKNNEIVRIRETVDWKYEIGDRTVGICRPGSKKPALLFENIRDYPGFEILTNGLGSYSRMAILLGLDPETPFRDIVQVFKERISHPIEPVMENNGAHQENMSVGEDVNLMRLPVPWWSKKDGGRYIGTWHLNITKDPETGIRNVGIYRMQLLGARTAAISMSRGSHLGIQLSKAERVGRALDMAVAIGVSETLIMAAAAAPPFGIDEYYLAGAFSQDSVALTKARTIDLEVPAHAEIVIEGKILPNSRVREGPFLDYSGIPKGDSNAPIFEVSCLIYRSNPIFRGAAIGTPGAEDHLLFSLLSCAGCLDFHGSRVRHLVQNCLLQRRLFAAFQQTGQFGGFARR